MKKVIFISSLIFNTFNLLSQSSGFDISILLNKKTKTIEIVNDTLVYQEFILKEKINYIKHDTYFNKNGILETRLIVPHINRDLILKFIYENNKNKNTPLICKKNKVKNILTYPKDFIGIKIEKLRVLLNEAKNIYIIESDSITGFYILKKVDLMKEIPGM